MRTGQAYGRATGTVGLATATGAIGVPRWAGWTGRLARNPVAQLLGAYLAVRAILALATLVAAHLAYGGSFTGPLYSWDTAWYLRVAAHLYPVPAPRVLGQLTYGPGVFEPVFPLLIRALEAYGLGGIWAAQAISLVGGAVAVLLVWRLASQYCDEQRARRAAVLFAAFPGMAVAWGLSYAECVGLALAAGCLLLLARRRFAWAGLAGMAATATSPLALPLALAALVPAVQALRRRERPGALVAAILVPLGFAGWVVWLGLHYHDWWFWWHLQHQAWGASIDFGRSLSGLLVHPMRIGYQGPGWLEWAGAAAVCGAAATLARARLPAALNYYCGGVLVLLAVSNSLGFKPRLLAWAFPVAIAVGAAAHRRTYYALLAAFTCLLPVVFILYTTQGNSLAQP